MKTLRVKIKFQCYLYIKHVKFIYARTWSKTQSGKFMLVDLKDMMHFIQLLHYVSKHTLAKKILL